MTYASAPCGYLNIKISKKDLNKFLDSDDHFKYNRTYAREVQNQRNELNFIKLKIPLFVL
jgi:hypothetical protein